MGERRWEELSAGSSSVKVKAKAGVSLESVDRSGGARGRSPGRGSLGAGEWASPSRGRWEPRREPEGRQAGSPPQGLSLNSCARLTQQRPSCWGWDLAQGSDLPHPCRGSPRGSLGQAADWPAETGSDGGEVKETGETTGLGLACVSTRTADSTDKTGN